MDIYKKIKQVRNPRTTQIEIEEAPCQNIDMAPRKCLGSGSSLTV